jgi:outer membrane lipoprotein-sorting protein
VGARGDVLELIDLAPARLQTLAGRVTKWTHHERSQRAADEIGRRNGGSGGTILGRRSGSVPESEEQLRVWLDRPARWRLEGERQTDVSDGTCHWWARPGHVTVNDEKQPDLESTELGPLLWPGHLLFGTMRFDDPEEDEILGRRSWRVGAHVTATALFGTSLMMGLAFPGVDHTFWFDLETGIILRHIGLLGQERCAVTAFIEVTIDQPIPDATFRFVAPADAEVTRPIDGILRTAAARGVDLRQVDTSDVDAVRRALTEALRPASPSTEDMRRRRRATHQPVGGPPDDEASARAAVGHAFSHLGDVAEDGTTLGNVQGGQGLAAPLAQARRRLPGSASDPVTIVVDDLTFVRPDEAVVWFSIEVNGTRTPMVNGREGRALCIDGRWLVSHATVAGLIMTAGVPSPRE